MSDGEFVTPPAEGADDGIPIADTVPITGRPTEMPEVPEGRSLLCLVVGPRTMYSFYVTTLEEMQAAYDRAVIDRERGQTITGIAFRVSGQVEGRSDREWDADLWEFFLNGRHTRATAGVIGNYTIIPETNGRPDQYPAEAGDIAGAIAVIGGKFTGELIACRTLAAAQATYDRLTSGGAEAVAWMVGPCEDDPDITYPMGYIHFGPRKEGSANG